MSFISSKLFAGVTDTLCNFKPLQIRNKWPDHRIVKDVKRRKANVDNAPMRLRVNSLRKNDILPVEIRELADAQIAALPNDSRPLWVTNRCAITSRPRGVVHRWRLSRFVFRHLSDYNLMSGIQRAMW